MKRIIVLLPAVLWLLDGGQVFSQTVIDLRTGIFGNDITLNQQIPTGSYDDTWILAPNQPMQSSQPTAFQNVFVSNGVFDNGECQTILTSFPNSGSKWISPKVVFPPGDAIDFPGGLSFYIMTFNFPGCQGDPGSCAVSTPLVKSATFNFRYLEAGAITIVSMSINGHTHHNIVTQTSISNLVFSIPGSEIVLGQNTIMIKAQHGGCIDPNDPAGIPYRATGLFIDADLTIYPYELTDINGNAKSEFCLEEDVFLNGYSTVGNNYALDLYYNNNHLASKQVLNAKPYWVNLTNIFENLLPGYFSLNTTGTYKVALTVEDPCDETKTIVTTKEFKYKCCSNSLDASFSLITGNSKLEGKSKARGIHEWEIYSSPNSNTGPYSHVNTINDVSKFSLDILPEGPACYYVKHKVVNECGEICTSQSACKVSCEVGDCIVAMPTAPAYNPASTELTWNTVPGAQHYFVEIVINGCCGSGQTASPSQYHSFIAATSPYPIDLLSLAGQGEGGPTGGCYLVKVYAVCQDGSLSVPSTLCVEGVGGSRPGVNGIGEGGSEDLQVEIYPNPSKGVVSIDVGALKKVDVTIEIFDKTGRLIKTFDNIKETGNTPVIKWTTEGYSKGIYLVKIVTSDNRVANKKLVIE